MSLFSFLTICVFTGIVLLISFKNFSILCAGKAGNPFQTTQGNRLSCRDQEGRRGSEEAVPGPSVFPSGEPGVLKNGRNHEEESGEGCGKKSIRSQILWSLL